MWREAVMPWGVQVACADLPGDWAVGLGDPGRSCQGPWARAPLTVEDTGQPGALTVSELVAEMGGWGQGALHPPHVESREWVREPCLAGPGCCPLPAHPGALPLPVLPVCSSVSLTDLGSSRTLPALPRFDVCPCSDRSDLHGGGSIRGGSISKPGAQLALELCSSQTSGDRAAHL